MEKGERKKYFDERVVPVLKGMDWGEWTFDIGGDDSSWWFYFELDGIEIVPNPFWEDFDGIPVEIFVDGDLQDDGEGCIVLPFDVTGEPETDARVYREAMLGFFSKL